MKRSMRSRIHALSQFTMIAAVLVAGLVIVASRLPSERGPASSVAISPVHSESRPATVTATRRQITVLPTVQPAALPTQPPATATPLPLPTRDVSNRIGILVGHWGYDTGAICADGLREVDITLDVAQRVAVQLQALGYEVDLLQEQDPDKPHPPLQNYRAAALIALHVDSCVPGASGFKVSRWAFSQMPAIEDRLVECIYNEYSAATGLARHDDSITIDMWNYYAFREIAEPTPGTIIEMGFMTGDRWLLVQRPDLVARGIVNGLLCFLQGSSTS